MTRAGTDGVPREGAGRGTDGRFIPRPGLRRAPGTLEGADVVQRMLKDRPGRVSSHVPPEPPSAEETPYRSLWTVSYRHSADGNSYRKGSPIPEAEAIRQGQMVPRKWEAKPSRCPRCKGSGLRMSSHAGRTHNPGCPGCLPCHVCGGSGKGEPEGAASGGELD